MILFYKRLEEYQRQAEDRVRDIEQQIVASQTQLTEARKQSQMLKAQLGALKLTLERQEQSLQNANRLLRQYEQEERLRFSKIKRQRNIAYVIAAAAIYFVIRKS